MRNLIGFVVCGTLFMAAPLCAQENGAWPDRVVVSIDVPFQPLNNDFTESLSFADTLRKTENVTFAATYESARGALFDAGAGVRLAGDLGIGVTASWTEHSSGAEFDLKLPNPIVANTPLSLAGSVTGLKRQELGVHVQALYAVGLGRNVRLMLGAGPSIFNTTHDLVRSIAFFRLPGFTGLQFDQALIAKVEKTTVGFNVGADVTWAATRHLGIGAVTRYSRANLTLDPGSQSGLNRAIETRAGGLHVGGGVRLLF